MDDRLTLPESLAAALPDSLARLVGVPEGIAEVCAAWAKLVDPRFVHKANPANVRFGRLRIRCDDAVTTMELQHQADAIVAALTELLPDLGVRRVSCFTGPRPVTD